MTFKLPANPSPKADIHELADFVELHAWTRGSISRRTLVAMFGRSGESEPNIGCDDIDDQNDEYFGEVIDEIGRRKFACGSGYPFNLTSQGNVVELIESSKSWQQELYGYLLLSTRLNMNSNRYFNDIDGTLLLEEISSCALKIYLGSLRARSIVFGTSAGSDQFPKRVSDLCKELKEAIGFRALSPNIPVNANDDKLDVVGWIPFKDSSPSQVIVFGQCKTGTAWTESLCHLNPQAFIKKWIDGHFLVDPLRAFFVSEAINRSKLGNYAAEGGIIFDRCRIVDSCVSVDKSLALKIRAWSKEAFKIARKQL